MQYFGYPIQGNAHPDDMSTLGLAKMGLLRNHIEGHIFEWLVSGSFHELIQVRSEPRANDSAATVGSGNVESLPAVFMGEANMFTQKT